MNTVPPTIVQNVHPLGTSIDAPEPPPWPAEQLALFEDINHDIRKTLRPQWAPGPVQ